MISKLKSVSFSQGGSTSNLNMNLYATKKTAAEGMLDIALFLANITHMKTVIEQGAGYRYCISIVCVRERQTGITESFSSE